MPDHAEIFAYCPATRAPSPSPPGVQSTPPHTHTLVGATQTRQMQGHVRGSAAAAGYRHHQPREQQQQQQSQSQAKSYQACRGVRPVSRVEVREREVEGMVDVRVVEGDNSSDATSPPSPATASSTVAVLSGSNNSTARPNSPSPDPADLPDAPLPAALETTIHPKGNLVLVVGPDHHQRHILVHAETIEHFSTPWHAVVRTSTRSKLFTTRRTAHLPDDDADMMLVLMYVSHPWHLSRVPCALSFAQLLALARLCGKYDANVLVAPFVRRWLVPHQGALLAGGREAWLFVARQFGLERHYVTLAHWLVVRCRVDKWGVLFAPGRWEPLGGLVPEDALVEIRRKRMQALAALLNVVYTLVDGLENGDTCRATFEAGALENGDADGAVQAERAMCTHCNHGELIRYLKIEGFWPPIVQSSILTVSVAEVFDKLASIPAISYRHMRNAYGHAPDDAPGSHSGNAHAACDVGRQLAAIITDVRNKLEMPIAESTTAAIRENAEKVGLRGEAAGPHFLLPEEPLDEVRAAVWGQGMMES